MDLIDAHAHLQNPCFAADLAAVMGRAAGAGVRWVCCNGTGPQDWQAVAALASRHDGSGAAPLVIPWFGLHPWYLGYRTPDWRERLDALLAAMPAGVGEIGLDRDAEERDGALQEAVFRAQLALARRHGRPATVHCLRAWGWLEQVLRTEERLPAGMIVHAYGGPVELLAPLAARGAYFSFACNVLRPRSRRARAAAAAVPLDRLLVETDAPDIPPPAELGLAGPLLPDGRRRTEPAFAAPVLAGIAALRGMPAAELAEAVMANARRLCGALVAAAPPRPSPATAPEASQRPQPASSGHGE